MDIACPNCAATYRVPEALLAQGKPLRCAACGETWVPELPAAAPAPPPEEVPFAENAAAEPALAEQPPAETPLAEGAAPPEVTPGAEAPPAGPRAASPHTPPPLNPPPLQRRSSQGPGRRSGAALRLAWVASIATVLLALAGLVLYGDAIAAAWPPFARVTALLGS